MNRNDAFCFKLLRESDRDRYLTVLFAPKKCRGPLASLYAFNVEIARIAETVRKPMIGEIRLRWWRDAIESNKSGEGNPVLSALLSSIHQYDLPKAAFLRYCDARVFDLYSDKMPNIASLEGYCGETASALLQLSCQILDKDAARQTTEATGHGGVAQALCGILRTLPAIKAKGQHYFPANMIESNPDDFIQSSQVTAHNQEEKLLGAAIALTRKHYQLFFESYKDLPKSVWPAFLPLAIVPDALKQIEQKGIRCFKEYVTPSPIRHYILIAKAGLNGHMPKIS